MGIETTHIRIKCDYCLAMELANLLADGTLETPRRWKKTEADTKYQCPLCQAIELLKIKIVDDIIFNIQETCVGLAEINTVSLPKSTNDYFKALEEYVTFKVAEITNKLLRESKRSHDGKSVEPE